MRSSSTVLAAAIVSRRRLVATRGVTPQAPATSAAESAGPPRTCRAAGGRPAARRPAGRGGGRGNPAAALFIPRSAPVATARALEGGRAPSLFDDQWLHATDDESHRHDHPRRHPDTEMVAVQGRAERCSRSGSSSRTCGRRRANLKDKPIYVPDPDGQIIKSEKQTFKIEVVARNLETPWGLAFLPDGRLLVTERPGRLRIVENGKLLPEPVKGTPKVWEKQDGGLFDVEVHPQYARNGWIYLAYSETRAGLHAAALPPPADAAAAAAAAPPPQGRPRPRRPARSAVDDGDRARQDQQEQRVGRSAGAVPRAARAVQLDQRALRIALHLRQAGPPVLHARREAADGGRAGSVEADSARSIA